MIRIEYTARNTGSGYIVACSTEAHMHVARQCIRAFLKEKDYDIFPYGRPDQRRFLLMVPKGFSKKVRFRRMREALHKI